MKPACRRKAATISVAAAKARPRRRAAAPPPTKSAHPAGEPLGLETQLAMVQPTPALAGEPGTEATVLVTTGQAEPETVVCDAERPVDLPGQPDADSPADGGMVSAPRFYLTRTGGVFGPYSELQLREALRLGIFMTSDQAAAEGGTAWLEVSRLLPSEKISNDQRQPVLLTLPPIPHHLTKRPQGPQTSSRATAWQESPLASQPCTAPTGYHQLGGAPAVASPSSVSLGHKMFREKRVLTVVLVVLVVVSAVMAVVALKHRVPTSHAQVHLLLPSEMSTAQSSTPTAAGAIGSW